MSTFVKVPRRGFQMQGRVIEGDPPIKPKRFLVFACDTYYPAGGWDDFIGSADTAADAITAALAARRDNCQIIDMETGEEVPFDEKAPA